MPYLSKLQARWANATRQPFAKRWNKLTNFGALPEKKDSGATGLAIPPTGTNALFNQMGIARRRQRMRKECTCGIVTKAATGAPGELISPGVRRIRGNLCNVHGRYGACDTGAGGKKPKKGRQPAKPKQTPAQRAQARDAEHQANRGKTLSSQGYGADDQAALEALRSGAQPGSVSPALIDQGVVEQATDGSYRLTSSGRALLNAAGQGDAGRARDTVSGARDRLSARRQRQQDALKRQQDASGKRAAAQIGRELSKNERDAKRVAAQAAKKPSAGGGKKPSDDGKTPTATPRGMSTTRRRRTPSSLGATASPGVSSGGKKPRPKAPAPEKPTKAQIAPALRSAATALSEGADVSDEQVQQLITSGLAKLNKDGAPILTAAGLRATMKAFTVFKSSDGTDRWLAITTTAYEDKDREIISTKAIAGAVAFGDKTKERGPLLYWHVPGLILGDCDFQAQGGPGGRFLLEGGTFRTKALADLGATLASQGYQMSPGFIHLDNEPQNGVYDNILIYERSSVPQSRAANHFTRFHTKEEKVLTEEKAAEYRERAAGNAEALDMLEKLLSTTQKEDDAAQARNVVFKEAPEWAQLLITRIDRLEETQHLASVQKAFPPAAAAAVEEEAEEADDGMEMEEEAGGMDDAAFAQMLAQAVVQAITPLFDIEKKMAGHLNDFKTAMGGAMQQKDDASAAQAAQIAALDAKLKELTGDLPSSVLAGAAQIYRASESPLTRLTTEGEQKVKESLTQIPPGLSDPSEIGAYQLIFGNQ